MMLSDTQLRRSVIVAFRSSSVICFPGEILTVPREETEVVFEALG